MQETFAGPSKHRQGAKVAISRLERGPPPPAKRAEGHKEERVTRACKLCRKRKVRCSGDLPQCTNCRASNAECVYEQARRDRLREAMQLNQTFATLLRDLSSHVDAEGRKRIDEVLEDAEDDLSAHTPVPSIKSLGKRSRKQSSLGDEEQDDQHGEAFVTASVGSNEDLDFLGEDLLRSRESRETGYVGQNSEIQWLRSVQRQSERGNSHLEGQRYGPPGASRGAVNQRSDALHERRQNARPAHMRHITDANFYLDSDDLEIDIAVDPYDVPDADTAQQLFDCYMRTVHDSFPIMPTSFQDQFRRYIESVKLKKPYQVPEKWRATMNLIFAIGAKYSHLMGYEWRGDERDHLVFMTRAVHLLGLRNTAMIISGPDLGLVQATGTLAFYFLVIGHVSRAWIMIGVSVRLALALGLHLRNEDPSADTGKKESLAKIWWSLHIIECLVSSITGRPPVLASEDCTVFLPQDLSDREQGIDRSQRTSRARREHKSPQSSASGSASESGKQGATVAWYLHTSIKLSLISQKALSSLYAPRTAARSWEHIQSKIKELLNELEEWAKPVLSKDDFPIQKRQKVNMSEHDRLRFLLQIEYWSAKIMITRPCLCRIEDRISHQSDTSLNFNYKAAETCVKAARQLANLFPDEPDMFFIYSQGPWWSVIHIIMQVTAVLLLEMAYEGKHIKDENEDIVTSIKKMIRWLRSMQGNDPVAARAYNVVWTILRNCAPTLQSQANELLAEDIESPHSPPPRTYQSPSSESPQAELWSSGQSVYGGTEQPYVYDPRFLQQHASEPQFDAPYASFRDHSQQYQLPVAFSNPFYTSFDQGAPVVNMQDLWMNPASSGNLDLDFAGMSFQQHHRPSVVPQAPTMMSQDGQPLLMGEGPGMQYTSYQHHTSQPQ